MTVERDRLVDAARSFAEASLAPVTRRKYQEAFEDFSLWCHDHSVAPLPASAETVGCYCSDLALRGLAMPTIQLRLAAPGPAGAVQIVVDLSVYDPERGQAGQ